MLGFSAWRAHRPSLGSKVQTVDMRAALPATMLGTAHLQIWLRTWSGLASAPAWAREVRSLSQETSIAEIELKE